MHFREYQQHDQPFGHQTATRYRRGLVPGRASRRAKPTELFLSRRVRRVLLRRGMLGFMPPTEWCVRPLQLWRRWKQNVLARMERRLLRRT